MRQRLGKRGGTLLSLLVIVPVGFYSKFYSGLAAEWVNDSLGGAFYEIFWCLLVFLFLDRPRAIAGWVLGVTCGLEFLQLWHPPVLEFIRGYFLGRTLLGTTFAWSDFSTYVLGCGIGWLWMVGLQRMGRRGVRG